MSVVVVRRSRMAVALAVALIVIACGSVNPTAMPATPAASNQPGSSDFAGPTLDPARLHADPALERALPASVAGHAMAIGSFGPGDPDAADMVGQLLGTAGHAAADLHVAIAVADDPGIPFMIVALSLPGSSSAELARTLLRSPGDATVAPGRLGDRDVTVITDAAGVSWAYAGKDALFILGGDPALADQAVRAFK